MINKFFLSWLFLFIFIILPVNAANVSILIMETGLAPGKMTNQYSIMLENTLLDAFYNMGHIVSNAPIIQLTIKPESTFPYEAERDFKNAEDGGMEYFLIAVVDYLNTPNNVSLRLFKLKSQELIGEKIFFRSSSANVKEDNENINKAVINLLQVIEF